MILSRPLKPRHTPILTPVTNCNSTNSTDDTTINEWIKLSFVPPPIFSAANVSMYHQSSEGRAREQEEGDDGAWQERGMPALPSNSSWLTITVQLLTDEEKVMLASEEAQRAQKVKSFDTCMVM